MNPSDGVGRDDVVEAILASPFVLSDPGGSLRAFDMRDTFGKVHTHSYKRKKIMS